MMNCTRCYEINIENTQTIVYLTTTSVIPHATRTPDNICTIACTPSAEQPRRGGVGVGDSSMEIYNMTGSVLFHTFLMWYNVVYPPYPSTCRCLYVCSAHMCIIVVCIMAHHMVYFMWIYTTGCIHCIQSVGGCTQYGYYDDTEDTSAGCAYLYV